MKIIVRGKIQNGTMVIEEPLALPDGTDVIASIEPIEAGYGLPAQERVPRFETLAFHGMWADREDMADSVAWVRGVREQWRRPSNRD